MDLGETKTYIPSIFIPNVTELDIRYFLEYLEIYNTDKYPFNGIKEYFLERISYTAENHISINQTLYLFDYLMMDEEKNIFIKFVMDDAVKLSGNSIDCFFSIDKIKIINESNKSNTNIDYSLWKELTVDNANQIIDTGYNINRVASCVPSNTLLKYKLDEPTNFKKKLCSLNSSLYKLLELKDIKFAVAGGSIVSCLFSVENEINVEWPPNPSVEIDIFTWSIVEHNKLLYWFKNNFDCHMFTCNSVTSIFIKGEERCIQVIDSGLDKLEDIIDTFDWDVCKICCFNDLNINQVDLDFHLCVMPGFIRVKFGNRMYGAKYPTNMASIQSYKKKVLKQDEFLLEKNLNKHYTYNDESLDEMLSIIKLLYNNNYAPTRLPLLKSKNNWKIIATQKVYHFW
jgi:hypothetical protein